MPLSSDDESDDEERTVQYGIRQSRRNTSHQYRDSSSLDPSQRMEQEVYYHAAEDSIQHSFQLMQLICTLNAIYQHYRSIMSLYVSNVFFATIQSKLDGLKKLIEYLLLISSFVTAHGEIAFLYAEDLSIFIRRRNRFKPKRFRTIQDISRGDCYLWFGIHPAKLERLFAHWRIPDTFRTASRHVYSGQECMIIFLYHLIKGQPFTTIAHDVFGGDPRDFSKMCELMIDHLYENFYNKISGTSLDEWLPDYLDLCRELIHSALGNGAIWEVEYDAHGQVVDENWIIHHFEFDSFRIFGFLDDMALPTSRPGTSARKRFNFEHDLQRPFYSGYLRRHGLKAQVVWLPIGIVGSVFVTEMRQNDNGVQNMSGLNNYLLSLLSGILIDGLFPCLYCDGIFATLATILPRFTNPTPAEHLLNMRLSSLREIIEHVFGDHHNRFGLFRVPDRLQLFNHGVRVRKMFLVSFFYFELLLLSRWDEVPFLWTDSTYSRRLYSTA
jgi:hypothetical protein